MLTVRNNWESLTYYWKGKPLTDITDVTLSNGKTILARLQPVTRRYSDHGHEHPVHTREFQVFIDDINQWVTLDYLKRVVAVHLPTTYQDKDNTQ